MSNMGLRGALEDDSFSLLEHVPMPVFVYEVRSDDYILRFVNTVAARRSPDILTFLGRPMGALYRDQPSLDADARRALDEGGPITREVVMRRHDQTEAVTPVKLTWVRVAEGHVAVFTQAPDDERASVDAALRESEARYRGLFASLPDAVVVRSADGRILACNDAAARLWGAEAAAQILGSDRILRGEVRVFDESGRELVEEELPSWRAITTAQRIGPTITEIRTDSGSRWLRVVAQPIFASTGAVSASVTVLTDISERMVAERSLRAAAARLDLALNAGRMGIWEYDEKSDSGWWSENLNQIFGLSPNKPQGIEAFSRLLHPEDAAGFLKSGRRYREEDPPAAFEFDFRIVGDDDVARWARIQGRRIADERRFIGTITDITEQRRLEEELRRAHRLESIGRLAGGVAHDFNNLLAAMLGSVELLGASAQEQQRSDLETIRHAAVRASDLTKQLLAFARKRPIEFRPVPLGDLAVAVERMLSRLLGPRVEIALNVRSNIVVRGDPASLEQVLVNLVVNAKDAMPEGGRVSILVGEYDVPELRSPESRERSVPRAMIEVTDSGGGMDDATRRRIFDPFFTTKAQGTGLGLASSYGTVQQHGGDIEVESHLGRGTTFRVILPLLESVAPPSVPPSAFSRESVRLGVALVVDDEDLVRTTSARLLRGLGYQVLAASSAAEGLELSRAHVGPIELMLCDVAMPGRDGPSLAQELLALRPELRVIFASGYTDNSFLEGFERSVFLAKPYTRAELVQKISEVQGR